MISAHTSPADLAARILQPLARSLEEARQHLDLEPIDEAATDGASAARQDSHPAALPAVAIHTPRQPPPSGPSASGQPVGGTRPADADGSPTPPSEALAASTAHPTRRVSGSPDAAPSTPPASSAPAGFVRAAARTAGPAAAPDPSPAPAPVAGKGNASTHPPAPSAAASTVSAALRAAPAPATMRLVRADSPPDPAPPPTPRGTTPDSAPAALAPPETWRPDDDPPRSVSVPPDGAAAPTAPATPSAPRQWRLRPSPPTETAPAPAAPAAEAAPTPTPSLHAGGATASLRPRDPALPRVMQAMAPVLDTAWRLTDAALAPEQGEPPSVTPEAPRVANHFHVNVALGDTPGTASRDRNQLEDTLTALLRDAARRQGLDV
ncbi:hypothetical protein [Zoogloea sp.]|uniref:hypothetical protein n=1 Tax=Zoogloea sp. TaxID=49181 RepID=UPI0035B07464